ncbi:MAG TPA: EAL domain-containing protein [Solirubrobacteraceae bacterium]|nr:EAL domain-containing protein [Solirubrobacteraceae bacterium]
MGVSDQVGAESDPAAPTGVVSLEGDFLRVSSGLAAALGWDQEALMELGALAVTHPADRDRLTAMLGLMRAGSIGKTKFRQRWLPADGGAVEGLVSGSVIHEGGAPAAFAFTVETSAPAAHPTDWESLFARTRQGIAVIGPDGRYVRVNDAYAALLGSVPCDVHGLPWLDTVPPDCGPELDRAQDVMHSAGSARVETLMIRRDGSCFEAQIELVLIDEPDGTPNGHLCLMRGAESEAGPEASIDEATSTRNRYDGVTGLPDVTRFVERLELSLFGAGASSVAVLVLGVETEQHRVGEPVRVSQAAVLREIAGRIAGKLEADGSVARLGDWSFAILLAGGDELTLAASARSLLKATSEPIVASGETHVVHATLGIAVAHRGDDAGDLIDAAERARRRARELGADRFEFIELGDPRPESPDRQLLDDIRHALTREELRLRYQPVFDLADCHISGVEVLLRWEHPSRTVLMPEMFLPAARRTGAIVSIGRWVLEQALRQLEQWNEELACEVPLRLFVNLSAPELADPALFDVVADAAEQTRINPRQLAVDVSDAALIEVRGAAWRSVAALRELGVTIVLDRFGTALSSLTHLERLPIDMVKLDRGCVAGLPDDSRERGTVKAMAGVAEARGLTTIACGVETEGQLEALAELGCTAAQGFLFAEPRAARAVTKLLRWRGERTGRAAS